MARTLKYQRDLTPGDVFGEEVLAGERLRNTTALALTVVDLLVIEDDDFQAAEDPTGGGLTVDERVDLVMQSSLCRGLDHYRAFKVRILYSFCYCPAHIILCPISLNLIRPSSSFNGSASQVAHAVEQVEFLKGAVIAQRGDVTDHIYILLSGRVDVLMSADSTSPLNALCKFDYFGESGYLNNNPHTKLPLGKFIEPFFLVAKTRVQALALPESDYHLLNGLVAMRVLDLYNARKVPAHDATSPRPALPSRPLPPIPPFIFPPPPPPPPPPPILTYVCL